MAKIHIAQLLCPKRHCITGAAFDPDVTSEDAVKKKCNQFLLEIGANPWCGICFSRDLKYEIAETQFATMEAIAPTLAAEIVKNYQTRELIQSLRRTAASN